MRTRIRLRRPSPALIISIVALVMALGGTAVAAKLGLGALNAKAKNETVGVGPLSYVETSVVIPPTGTNGLDVAAYCPPGKNVIGGGIKVSNDPAELVNDSHPIAGAAWGGTVINDSTINHTAFVTAICGKTRIIE